MTNVRSPMTIVLFLFLLAVICVSLLVLGMAIFGDLPELPSPKAPTPSPTSVGTPVGIAISPTSPSDQFRSGGSILVESFVLPGATPLKVMPTLIPTKTPTPRPSLEPGSTGAPAASPTSMPTSTSTPTLIYGQVQAANLNLRAGPGSAYGSVSIVRQDSQLIVLGQSSDGIWLKVRTSDNKEGWVAARFIGLPVDIPDLPVIAALPPPSGPIPLTLRRASVSGRLAPGQEQTYTFFENQSETLLILIFRPDVNANSIDHIQFVLYEEAKGQEKIIGAGSHPGTDRDGDSKTDELVWRGGPLTPGVQYHVRLTNTSNQIVEYCLATQDLYEWSCP